MAHPRPHRSNAARISRGNLKSFETGQLEYGIVVHPGADASKVTLAYRGAESVEITKEGALKVTTPVRSFGEGKPYVYQEVAGKRVEVASAYALLPLPLAHAGEGKSPLPLFRNASRPDEGMKGLDSRFRENDGGAQSPSSRNASSHNTDFSAPSFPNASIGNPDTSPSSFRRASGRNPEITGGSRRPLIGPPPQRRQKPAA
jgi:hypothetical protein